MTSKRTYQQQMEAQLYEVRDELKRLQKKLANLQGEGRVVLQAAINDLSARQETAELAMSRLRDTRESDWEEIKAELDQTWDDLKTTLSNALSTSINYTF
jgi:predicted  nucleic acid-binding Zn-ribbon protein